MSSPRNRPHLTVVRDQIPGPVEVTPCPDGPLLVRGAETVRDEHGEAHEVTRPVVAVCACGKSQRKPWCDGTHKVIPRP